MLCANITIIATNFCAARSFCFLLLKSLDFSFSLGQLGLDCLISLLWINCVTKSVRQTILHLEQLNVVEYVSPEFLIADLIGDKVHPSIGELWEDSTSHMSQKDILVKVKVELILELRCKFDQ